MIPFRPSGFHQWGAIHMLYNDHLPVTVRVLEVTLSPCRINNSKLAYESVDSIFDTHESSHKLLHRFEAVVFWNQTNSRITDLILTQVEHLIKPCYPIFIPIFLDKIHRRQMTNLVRGCQHQIRFLSKHTVPSIQYLVSRDTISLVGTDVLSRGCSDNSAQSVL